MPSSHVLKASGVRLARWAAGCAWVALVLGCGRNTHTAPSAAPCAKLGADASAFLDGLPGRWEGAAVMTPLGAMPYTLAFERLDADTVRGRSDTNGQAVHTWVFRRSEAGALTLDFHTTFGDSHAKGLCVVRVDADKGLRFAGGRPSALQVWVRPASSARSAWEADVVLRDQPHVRIVAERAAGP